LSEQEWLAAQFERCWPFLKEALASHPDTFEEEHVRKALETGDSQLWPLPNGAIITSIKIYPTGKKELRGWLAGGDLSEIVAAEPQIGVWGKERGCKQFVLTGRRGWLRALKDYRETATFLTREL
jgi:hypothetical protein